MIYPTLWIERLAKSGTDAQGQAKLVRAGREKVCPVKIRFGAEHTTVRTDSSGSHGSAQEITADVVLLALPRSRITVDDILIVNNNRVKVQMIHKRYTVTGVLDHNEVHCVAWK